MLTHAHQKPVIYLGPSLPLGIAQEVLDADYRPPIKRGDIEELLLSHSPSIIGIIDGLFFQSFSVSTKEILLALRKGITVLGASSMGALRAVELHPYGMKGIGHVFRMYKSGRIDADDEVGLVHDEDGHPLSEPLVDIRFALQKAVEDRIISYQEKGYLVSTAKGLYFPERTYKRLFFIAQQEKKIPEEKLAQLQAYLQNKPQSVKRDDALLLLELIAKMQAEDAEQLQILPPTFTANSHT
jgi:TfuA protein